MGSPRGWPCAVSTSDDTTDEQPAPLRLHVRLLLALPVVPVVGAALHAWWHLLAHALGWWCP